MQKNIPAEVIADVSCKCGECPTWHAEENRLYWTDIPNGKMYYWDAATESHELCYDDRPVGGMTIQSNGDLLLFRDKGNVVTFRDGKILRTIIEQIPSLEATRFNDVISDPRGRVFAGTMSFNNQLNGKLYLINTDGSYNLVSEGHGTPNGMGFTESWDKFYFTDSRKRRIYRYSYCPEEGVISDEEIFQQVSDEDFPRIGRSDGMTIDADGNIWSARYEGAQVLKISPTGELLESHPIPAANVTSLTFGGNQLDELFVTTVGDSQRNEKFPLAGSVFRLRTGVKGRPEFRSAVML